ncbi:TIGR04279 domain-containing protein, partial [Methermicoccus shengliensis]|uniref:TIGR04279 domain-containing protein n=1 Tax=Methermicoccus shengliensis TaxID=660064 RepID=UPI0012F6FB11
MTWQLTVSVPNGQTTTLSWNTTPYPHILLRIFNGTTELQPGVNFSEGTHHLQVIATYQLPPALVTYTIEEGGSKEIIQFMDHTSSPAEGNWTVLSGGKTIPSPTLLFRYDVTSTHKSYTVGSKNITIEGSKRLDEVAYPFTTYQLYLQNDTVNAAFYGASGFAGENVSFWLAPAGLDDVRDIDRGLRNGNTTPLRQLLNGAERLNATLDSGGDASASFSSVSAGSYVLFVTNRLVDPLTDPFIQIYSLTPVEVLKYDATVSAQSTIGLGAYELPVTISIGDSATQGAQYRYGALLIKDSAYRYIVDLSSDTSAANTNVDVNGERVIAGWDLIDINAANAQNVLRNTTGPNNGSVSINDLTTSTSSTVYLDTSTLGPGTYRLISAVYEKGKGIVALNVSNVTIIAEGAPNVHVRVESNTTTLFNGTITVPPNCTVVDTSGVPHFI